MTLFSNNNAVLIDNCANLHDLTVRLSLTEDLVAYRDGGFSLQLNAYPQTGQKSQDQTLTWFQYCLYVENDHLSYEIQYWASFPVPWPAGYTPNPPNTVEYLPVLPNDDEATSFGAAPQNHIARGSEIKIALSSDPAGNVVSVLFSVTDPGGQIASSTFVFPEGARYSICAFQVNLVGPGDLADATFISGGGTLTYSVSSGSLSVQASPLGEACGESNEPTGELSNAIYGDITPQSGSTVSQSLSYVWEGPQPEDLSDGVIYAITDDHRLLWYRHTGFEDGRIAWASRLPPPDGYLEGQIGHDWNFRQVFSAGAGVIYAITEDYRLLWYLHTAFPDGQAAFASPPPAPPGKLSGQVGEGWQFKQVFSAGLGVIYAITEDYKLLWYRHTGFADGQDTWAEPPAPAPGRLPGQIGEGWNFNQVFSGGYGVIYAITEDYKLLWYRHTGFADGQDTWAEPPAPTPGRLRGQIGEGWNFNQVFSGGANGVIYAITQDYRLLWYHHTGFGTGQDTWAPHLPVPDTYWPGQIGQGWNFEQTFSKPYVIDPPLLP